MTDNEDGRKTFADLVRVCPVIARLVQKDPALTCAIVQLLERGLAGVFEKYLADASAEVVQTVIREASLLDLDRVLQHREVRRKGGAKTLRTEDVEPLAIAALDLQKERRAEDAAAGWKSLVDGIWASVAFSGGSGTRFFSSLEELNRALQRPNEVLARKRIDAADPKGVFPISPVGGMSFFELVLADALDTGVRCGRLPLVLIMTSANTHDQTIRYLSGHSLWGLPSCAWVAFKQTHEPRLDEEGGLVVADERGHLAMTGDGHGGVYRALCADSDSREPLIAVLREAGIQHLVMHNVDNAAAHPFEIERLGFHLRENALFTISVVRKTDPSEKVGLALKLRSTGRVEVVEYNTLDPAIAAMLDPRTGRLRYDAANINTNLVALEAVRADIEPIVYSGKTIPSRIGPVKSSSLEMLNQHLTRLLDPQRVRAFEVLRDQYFLPTKNITGVDSVVSTTSRMSQQYARLLGSAGAELSSDALCDLHPCCGKHPESLVDRGIGPNWRLGPKTRLFLCARMGMEPSAPVSRGRLTLQPGSSLILDCARPYGEISIDKDRKLVLNPKGASRLSIGREVILEDGVRVVVRVGPGACLNIRDGHVFKSDVDLTVPAGQELTLP